MLKQKLTEDEQEALIQVMDGVGWNALIKFLQNLEVSYIKTVMEYNLNNGPEQLVIKKAKADGVTSLIKNLRIYRDKMIRGSK